MRLFPHSLQYLCWKYISSAGCVFHGAWFIVQCQIKALWIRFLLNTAIILQFNKLTFFYYFVSWIDFQLYKFCYFMVLFRIQSNCSFQYILSYKFLDIQSLRIQFRKLRLFRMFPSFQKCFFMLWIVLQKSSSVIIVWKKDRLQILMMRIMFYNCSLSFSKAVCFIW